MKNRKRILSVTVKRMIDQDGDTSYLGTYESIWGSEFTIDRKHALDCPQQRFNAPYDAVEQLERVIAYLQTENYKITSWQRMYAPDSEYWEALNDAQDIVIVAQDDIQNECTCGGVYIERGSYQYFDPGTCQISKFDANGSQTLADWKAESIKIASQNYDRMEALNNGDWYFVGIRAEAKISLTYEPDAALAITQTITSGGLWGTESDSEESYLQSIEQQELADLRDQLKQLGFGSRAISAAFKNIEHKSE